MKAQGLSGVYEHTFSHVRSQILDLSGLELASLEDHGIELDVDYEMFCEDYKGPELGDCHEGFVQMLRGWPTPWPSDPISSLNGLALAQFYFCWAWVMNEQAKGFISGELDLQGAQLPELRGGPTQSDSFPGFLSDGSAVQAANNNGCEL